MLRRVKMEQHVVTLADARFYTRGHVLGQWIKGKLRSNVNVTFVDGYNLSRTEEELIHLALKMIPHVTGVHIHSLLGIISVHGEVRSRKEHDVIVSETRRLITAGLYAQFI